MWKQIPICAALLSASQFMCPAWAQDRIPAAVPVPPNLAYPVGSEITFQWTYSCITTNIVYLAAADHKMALQI
jgi:hypothetical protein